MDNICESFRWLSRGSKEALGRNMRRNLILQRKLLVFISGIENLKKKERKIEGQCGQRVEQEMVAMYLDIRESMARETRLPDQDVFCALSLSLHNDQGCNFKVNKEKTLQICCLAICENYSLSCMKNENDSSSASSWVLKLIRVLLVLIVESDCLKEYNLLIIKNCFTSML